ncbi:hypothetical protein H9L39_07137 [Fusarium oxysporum f. sp. albedinis]|nr:hypothetical protein H9L39_07137 [Fusarium oxysporum f. sp. albedinis]
MKGMRNALSDEPTTLLAYQPKSLSFPRDLDLTSRTQCQCLKRKGVKLSISAGEMAISDIQPLQSHSMYTVISSPPRLYLISASGSSLYWT